jgi:ATP synthase in type III secretion protein N
MNSVNRLPFLQTPVVQYGKCVKVNGLLVEVSGINGPVGELCKFVNPDGKEQLGEILGLDRDLLLVCPYAGPAGLGPFTRVYPLGIKPSIPVGDSILGRVFDALGVPIDSLPVPQQVTYRSVDGAPPNPLSRSEIHEVFHTGVKSVDGMLTVGIGQRMGVFAPAGGGKSTLMGMLARGCEADVTVIALVGERGREVKEFIDDVLGSALEKSVLFVATADRHAVERARCVASATSAAEYFRDQGKRVLLMVDSMTRFGRAQREIGLALGEPPTRRGYPPSLFAELPKIFERAGNASVGSITAFYTVLMEDEDTADPLAEEVRSLLDGHIVLSRELAERGHFPAIAIDQSLSRLSSRLVSREHGESAKRFRNYMARQKELELLVRMGEYKHGNDTLNDAAISSKDSMMNFLQQPLDEFKSLEQTVLELGDSFIKPDFV